VAEVSLAAREAFSRIRERQSKPATDRAGNEKDAT
jgi:hypothetical protein